MDYSTTACFTGHRPPKLGGYALVNNAKRAAVYRALRKAVGAAVDRGYRTFISGMAQGTDQDAFEVVLEYQAANPELDIRLVAAVPFLWQEDPWPPHSQQHYRILLTKASEVVYLHKARAASKWKVIELLDARNHWMVDQSSLVIAVYDGSAGGTYNCLRYAQTREQKRDFIDINPSRVLEPGYSPDLYLGGYIYGLPTT